MEKEQEISTIVSVVLNGEESSEIKEMATRLGVSLSHLGRALIRIGLQDVNSLGKHKEAALLNLIKLGK